MNASITLGPDVLAALAREVAAILGLDREPEPEPWIDVKGAADHLACKPRRIYDLVHERRVPYVKDGARLLFRRSQLDAWLEPSGCGA